MPFLRRRGVMASENDMRRHTVIDPSSSSAAASLAPKPPPPRKSLAEDFLRPAAATTRPSLDRGNSVDESSDGENGNRSRRRLDANDTWPGGMSPLTASVSASVGRLSDDPFDRPESPPIQEETPKHRRFSMLRFRNASDSQLSTRMKQQQQQQQEKPPPMPRPPAIITTAPTAVENTNATQKKSSRMKLPMRMRRSGELPRSTTDGKLKPITKKDRRMTMTAEVPDPAASQPGKQTVTFQEAQPRPSTSKSTVRHPEPPAYGDENGSTLALPANRRSESEGSSSEHGVYASTTTTTTHTVSTTTFFRLPRRKQKQPEPLFPMAHLPQKNKTPALQPTASSSSLAPRDSTSGGPSYSGSPDATRPSTSHGGSTPVASPSRSSTYLGKPSASPATALFRPGSQSGQSSPTRSHINLRGRSSTLSSLGRPSVDDHQMPGTTRTSSSTGRKSFGDLLGLNRLRQNPDGSRQGSLTPATPGSYGSKNNSLQLPREREAVVLPERREDDTPAKYLARLEEVLSRGVIAAALAKGTDPFSASVLRSYMRTFGFFEEPMDIAIRKLLMEAELPKETQQIDRFLQAFANRYHECNPGIYSTPDQAYFIAFSLLILHTDVFNKNNKYKMQKPDYLKNTRGEGIFDDVLECFYDNITYTPFIHVEDDLDINGERIIGHKSKKKSIFPNGTPEPLKRSKDPIDPYTIILDGKLDSLRPPLKEQIPLEEHYSYIGTAKCLNVKELQKTFFRTGVLQIVSARSRPDAFMTEKTLSNPQEAHPGIVDIKITKVGTLWRKDLKKKKTRSPWQEWGAILTGAQLYFFRNTAWVKNLVHQYETHIKSGHEGVPLTFKPPLEQFKPDALMSTDGAVALWDMSYKKHKNAFVYVRHGGFEEVLLAQNEEDRNDWLAKLNYAAAFRTSGVRMRGLVGGNFEGQSRRAIRRLDSTEVTQVVQTPTGEVSINRGKIDHKMAQDILVARREVMLQKIEEGEEKLLAAQKHLDTQLRNARHLLILAPIQEKTRDQVRVGAAKLIAQLKWSRGEIWRLKCHRDILRLDLSEDLEINGDLGDLEGAMNALGDKPDANQSEAHNSPQKTLPPSSPHLPAPLSLGPPSDSFTQLDSESPSAEVFQTPPTSAATSSTFPKSLRDNVDALNAGHPSLRKQSVSSMSSSNVPARPPSPPRIVSNTASEPAYGTDAEEDEGERQVLEQAGLLEMEPSRTQDYRPTSSAEALDRPMGAGAASGADKDRNKIRRSLQRTLREGAGHLSHHRSHRRGKDSASSAAMSDETIRDDVLSRGTGSFTVHGKKASVIEFGSSLQNISTEDRLRQRKQNQVDDPLHSPASIDDDFHSILDGPPPTKRERHGSAASASTATARSFRELHRKYSKSSGRLGSAHGGGLVVPSDDDSDAALSFSEGRRSPLPPVEDGSGEEDDDDDDDDDDDAYDPNQPRQAQFFTPEPPGSPVADRPSDGKADDEEEAEPHNAEHLARTPVQTVGA